MINKIIDITSQVMMKVISRDDIELFKGITYCNKPTLILWILCKHIKYHIIEYTVKSIYIRPNSIYESV